MNVIVAFLPAVVFGLAFGAFIKQKLFHPVPVATAFLVGGLIILWVEARHKRAFGERDLEGRRLARVETVDDMTVVDALKVGLVQCLAMIPGTSRSGATIIGGMLFGLSRRAATEFSFYLAIPTLIGAGVYSLWKQRGILTTSDLPQFSVGLVLAFFSALRVHPLADPLHLDARLHDLRLVPHRVRRDRARDSVLRLGRLVARMTRARAVAAFDRALAFATAAVIAWGVLVPGWSPFVVMLLFWFENVVIGLFNVVKMLATGLRIGAAGLLGAVALSAFFAVHYGLFTAVHGTFVALLFGGAELGREAMNGGLTGPLGAMLHQLFADRDGWIAVAAIALLHLSELVQWLVRTRERPPPLKDLMRAPYGRIMILHVTLIASAFLMQALDAPVAGALLLVGLKLAFDLVTPGQERGREEDPTAPVKGRDRLIPGRR